MIAFSLEYSQYVEVSCLPMNKLLGLLPNLEETKKILKCQHTNS